jgi:hypothetical protein
MIKVKIRRFLQIEEIESNKKGDEVSSIKKRP